MPDAHKNLAVSTVATAPSPASSGTSLVVASGHGARFPAAPFNATVWPATATPDPTNAEIVRVTAISTDTLTITRAQEGTTARAITVGDRIAATITAKSLTDIENAAVYGYFDIRNYGAAMDDSTDDADAIDDAIAALEAAGGGVLMISGRTVSSRNHVIEAPCNLMGLGAGARLKSAQALSRVRFTSTTSTGFDLKDPGSRSMDVAIVHTAFNESTLGVTGTAPTAGFGLRFGETATGSGDGTHLTRVLIQGFYTNLDIDNATEYGMDGCQIWAPVHTNVRLRNTTEPDFGDATFTGSWFIPIRSYSNASYNIRWESGGGLKLIGCKFNGGASSAPYACTLSHVSLTAGTGVSTGILISEGTSYENYELYAVDLLVSGSGTFDYVSISGGEVAPYATGGNGFRIRGRSGHVLKQVSIQGVNMVGAGGGAVPITLDYCDQVRLNNTQTGWSTVDAITNSTNVLDLARVLPRSSCRVRRTADQSLTTSAENTVLWTAEDHDDAGYHDTVSNQNRFTAQVTGYHRLSGPVYITGSGTAEAYVYFSWGGGGSSPFGAGTGGTYAIKAYPGTASVDTGSIYMTAGQWIDCKVYVTSGSSVEVDYTGSHLTFERLS